MLLFILIILTDSSFIPCNVANCESCSIQSTSICINCDTGFINKGLDCILESEFLVEPVENCLLYTADMSCTSCKAGYYPLFGRCEPYCHSICICITPYACYQYRNLNNTENYHIIDGNRIIDENEKNYFDQKSELDEVNYLD